MKVSNYIINPINNKELNVNSKQGKNLINNYIKNLEILQGGGNPYYLIYDPSKNKNVLVNSVAGKQIIKKYLHYSRGGAAQKETDAERRTRVKKEYAAKGRAVASIHAVPSTKIEAFHVSVDNHPSASTSVNVGVDSNEIGGGEDEDSTGEERDGDEESDGEGDEDSTGEERDGDEESDGEGDEDSDGEERDGDEESDEEGGGVSDHLDDGESEGNLLPSSKIKKIFEYFNKGNPYDTPGLLFHQFSAVLQLYFGNTIIDADKIAYMNIKVMNRERLTYDNFEKYMDTNKKLISGDLDSKIRYLLDTVCNISIQDPSKMYLHNILNKMLITGEMNFYSWHMDKDISSEVDLNFNNWSEEDIGKDADKLQKLIDKYSVLGRKLDKKKQQSDCVEILKNYKMAIIAWFRLQLLKHGKGDTKCSDRDALDISKLAKRVFDLNTSYFN